MAQVVACIAAASSMLVVQSACISYQLSRRDNPTSTMPQVCLYEDAPLCMVLCKPWTWLQPVCICRIALYGPHMHMAAGLGMLGSLTCVRLLRTVSKTGAIIEKSVPGELSSWLDLRRLARCHCARHVES